MNSDSDESYENDSPNFAFSPDVGAGATPAYNCAIGGDGKRKVSISSRGSRHQGLSATRPRNGGSDEMSEHRRKRRKGGQITTPDSSQDPSYACPYFKNDPGENKGCAEWNKKDIHRVKEHIKRSHLKPIQCPRCNVYRAGDNGQIHIHLRDGECQKAKILAPIESDILAKAKALERRSLSWERIYQILFPDCIESEIPTPFWQSHIEPSTTPPAIKLESPPVGTYGGDVFEERLNEELGGFVAYFQSQVPRLVQELFHEYQTLRRLKFEYSLSTGVGDGGVNFAHNQTNPPEAPTSDPTYHTRKHPQDTGFERSSPRQPNSGKKNPRPGKEQTWAEKSARKPTENAIRERQGVPSPSRHHPEAQNSVTFNPDQKLASLHHDQDDKRQVRGEKLMGKPTGDGARRRHSTAPPLVHPQHMEDVNSNTDPAFQQHNQQNGQEQLRRDHVMDQSTVNETQRRHGISSPFLHQAEPQHSSDMSNLNQNFAALQHGQQDSKAHPDHAESCSLASEPDPSSNDSSPVGFEDFARAGPGGNGQEAGSGYDPAVLWGLNVLEAYDWRF